MFISLTFLLYKYDIPIREKLIYITISMRSWCKHALQLMEKISRKILAKIMLFGWKEKKEIKEEKLHIRIDGAWPHKKSNTCNITIINTQENAYACVLTNRNVQKI